MKLKLSVQSSRVTAFKVLDIYRTEKPESHTAAWQCSSTWHFADPTPTTAKLNRLKQSLPYIENLPNLAPLFQSVWHPLSGQKCRAVISIKKIHWQNQCFFLSKWELKGCREKSRKCLYLINIDIIGCCYNAINEPYKMSFGKNVLSLNQDSRKAIVCRLYSKSPKLLVNFCASVCVSGRELLSSSIDYCH